MYYAALCTFTFKYFHYKNIHPHSVSFAIIYIFFLSYSNWQLVKLFFELKKRFYRITSSWCLFCSSYFIARCFFVSYFAVVRWFIGTLHLFMLLSLHMHITIEISRAIAYILNSCTHSHSACTLVKRRKMQFMSKKTTTPKLIIIIIYVCVTIGNFVSSN